MDLGLRDRVALVGGASRGIGFGIASELAAEGASVAITGRTEETLSRAAASIGALPIVFDSSELDAVGDVVGQVERELGPISLLVLNTGGPPPGADPLGFSRAQWELAHRTLVLEPMTFISRVAPGMAERGFGRVVLVASSAVVEPLDGLQLSNAHRPGVVAAFKLLARRYASAGVTFNTLLPGRIATDRLADASGSLEAAREHARTSIPAGRLGSIEDMGAAAAFLCSTRAGYITGTTILVDGGLVRSSRT